MVDDTHRNENDRPTITSKIRQKHPNLIFDTKSEQWFKIVGKMLINKSEYIDTYIEEELHFSEETLKKRSIRIAKIRRSLQNQLGREVTQDKDSKEILSVGNGVLKFFRVKVKGDWYEFIPSKKLEEANLYYSERTSASYIEGTNIEDENNLPKGFIQFVDELFSLDKNVINFFWKYLASLLIGENIFQKFVILFGSGANGKTTLIETLGEVFGSYISKIDANLIREGSGANQVLLKELYKMRNKRIIIVDEPGVKIKIDIPMVKKISGGDSFAIPSVRTDTPTTNSVFSIEAKLIIDTNHLFKLGDIKDEGLWR